MVSAASSAETPKAGEAGALRFTKSSFNFPEESGAVTITVRRHQGSAGAVSVEWEAAPGTATDADFVPATGVLQWADGDSAEKSFEVELIDDDEPEGLESVNLSLRNATGGATLSFNPIEASLKALPSDRPDDDDEGEDDDDDGEDDDEGEDDDDEEDIVIPPQGLIAFDQTTYQTRESVGLAVITVRAAAAARVR